MTVSVSCSAAQRASYAAIIAVTDEWLNRDEVFCPPSASAQIWRAIDALRIEGAPRSDVEIAEEISVLLACMQPRRRH